MANLKNRVKSTKSTTTPLNGSGKIGKLKKLLTGIKNEKAQSSNKSPKSSKLNINIKYPRGRVIKEKLVDTVLIRDSVLRKDVRLPKDNLVTKQGHIKHTSKDNLRYCNNILKSELLIEDSCDRQSMISTISCDKSLISKINGLNNNNTVTTDQNNKDKDKFTKLPTTKKVLTKELKKVPSELKDNKNEKLKSAKKTEISRRKPKKGLFECDYCRKQFDTKSSLRRHMYLHLYFNKHPCTQCNKVFSTQVYLSAHITRQHPNWEKHYMCNICDKPFLLKENLTVHLACHTNVETMYKCIYCKEKFTEQVALIEHEKTHLVNGFYDCIICEDSFDCRNKLSNHFKTHLRVKEYVCQYCGKEFLRMNSLRRHVQVCHTGVRIQCHICKKILKGHLSEHLRTHDKKRPHKCPDCGQCFTQSTQLNVHRRSHSGARPYPCRICETSFSHSNALMLHIRRHTGEKPFECAMCPMFFSQLPHMKAHMRTIHGKLNPYRCKKCNQFFKLKKELDNHSKVCKFKGRKLSIEEKTQEVQDVGEFKEPVMTLTRMRFLLALLLTMIATKEKLKYLGFNKRLIDDLLVDSLEAMDHTPCKDESLSPIRRLKSNIEILLNGTVPKDQMEKFQKENKSTEDILQLLTNEKK